MGACDTEGTQSVTLGGRCPGDDEFELTLFGPGYGESLVLHVGGGSWVLIDSCGRTDGPVALDYLRSIDVDPPEAVRMIAATHWHDDHIRGLAELVRVCAKASPNQVSVVLRVEIGDISVLLGSDLDRRGWLKILHDRTRRRGTASVFKVPHHGSENADDPRVWEELLTPDPVALLTPWQRGGRTLPSSQDVQRILARTSRA